MGENIKMRLRKSVSQEEREAMELQKQKEKEEELNRPFIEFKGKIKYIRNFIDCAVVCDDLIKLVDAATNFLVVGFDIEWPFSFQTGSGKVALIQISPDLNICYLIQISDLKAVPKGLYDIRKLSRDFSAFDGDKIIENCIDSGVLANKILPFEQRWSMERLVGYLLKMKISKDKKVRMSKWHISPLSKEQLVYAATDAYASLLLYYDLKRREESAEHK